MSRLTWIETLDGWMCGRYQIELAAPHLWVLSRLPKRSRGLGLGPAEVVRTAGSLRELKRAVAELEGSRLRRRRLLVHLGIMALLISMAVIVSALEWPVIIPVLVAMFSVALRTLVVWVDTATGGAWSVISDTYQ
jgi:hypothetical protein